jgi:hypothetical protein
VSHARASLALLVLAVVLAIGALLGVAASPVTADAEQLAAHAPTAAPAPAAVPAAPSTTAPALPTLPGYDASDPFLVALLGDSADLTDERAVELLLAADRVCEAMTAGVPLVEVEPVLAEELDLSGDEAHEFVRVAGWTRCSAA